MSKYVPFLKCKSGELIALMNLKEETKKKIVPFLNVPAPDYNWEKKKNSKSLQKHLSDVAERVHEYYPNQGPCFIDFEFVDEEDCGGFHYAEYFYFCMYNLWGIEIVPVTGLDRIDDANYQKAVKTFLTENKSDVGIRIDREYLELMSESSDELDSLIAFLAVPHSKVHLFFDLKSVEQKDVEAFADIIFDAIVNIPDIKKFASLTIVSGGMPVTMSKFKANTLSQHPRSDFALWKSCNDGIARSVNFGDYGIVNPSSTEIDPRTMNRSPRIRYTDNESWHIFKGQGQKNAKGINQTQILAGMLVKQPFYRGQSESWGEDYIYRCSKKEVKGNPTNWVTADTNQHIEFVVKQLAK